jgi:5'-3' exoribonuclease 1
MGIPSYYKKLIDRHKSLVSKHREPATAATLFYDFNCLVYQCLRDKGLDPYDGTVEWEDKLLEVVCKYVLHVWTEAGKPPHVFIAVDGVVPMAKIRQQRQRRFKSVWLAEEEARVGARTGLRWDTNAITPGTAFMDRLAIRLRGLCDKHGWALSDSHEPGEGEQKIMARIRASPPPGRVFVYGLDGDLIILSLLHCSYLPWFLMREAGEFGMAGARPEEFVYLNIGELKKIISEKTDITNYICAMSLMGNDFVPHSLSVKLRDGGHDILLAALLTVGPLVGAGGRLQWSEFRKIWGAWGREEERWIADGFAHKYKMRAGPPKNDYDRAMIDVTNLPVVWGAEKEIWSESGLKSSWKAGYSRWCFDATPAAMCDEYMQGLQWIWDYYTGKVVDMTWYYPWFLPPLWCDLAGQKGDYSKVKSQQAVPIAEQEQLAMVLPTKSWSLIRDERLVGVPAQAPAFWPDSFGFFSAGRRWFWECEALIPILSVRRLRAAAAHKNSASG